MVYEWKAGYSYPVSAQVAGEEIERIKASSGKDYIQPEELLEASRPVSAPLHKCFDWNDATAAEKWRTSQAHLLITRVTVKVVGGTEPVRAFVNVSKYLEKGKFVSVSRALEVSDYRETLLSTALMELKTFRNKYHRLKELASVIKTIDEVLNENHN